METSRDNTMIEARPTAGMLDAFLDAAPAFGPDQYRQVVEALDEGVIVQDRNGVVLTINGAARTILEVDLNEGESTMMTSWHLLDADGAPIRREDRPGRRCIQTGEPIVGLQVQIATRSGSRKRIELDARPLRHAGEDSPYAVVLTLRDITQRVAAQKALDGIARRREVILANATEGYRIVAADGTLLESAGRESELIDVTHRADIESMIDEAGSAAGSSVTRELRSRNADGDDVWTEVTVTNCLDEPAVGGLVVNHRDVTMRRQAERSMRFQSLLLNAAGQAIVGTGRRGRVVFWNDEAARMYGWTAEEARGKPVGEVIRPHESADRVQELTASLRRGDPWSGDAWIERRDGTPLPVFMTVTPIFDADGKFIAMVGVSTDISERKRNEAEMSRLALHDSLTGLWNREALVDHLDSLLTDRGTGRRPEVAVLFVGLDRFKVVNDAIGHQVGDQVLRETARRLTEAYPTAFVARFGGDQFVVVCDREHADDLALDSLQDLDAFDEPFVVDGYDLVMTASVGLANATDTDTSETLLRDADAAMYHAKEGGRARSVLFDDTLRQRSSMRLQWETSLRQALDRDEFDVVYQPVISMLGEQTVGFEALIRWNSAEHGVVSPADFIPIAEDCGMIVPIGEWMLTRATSQLAAWHRELERPDLWVAVNLSTRQLGAASLTETVANALVSSGVDAASLHLEITETAFMHDVDRAVKVLQSLRDMGVRIAVDDFGTGYSSLTYLKQLPIDTLKVDRSFVDGLGTDPHDSSIVRAIVSLGAALDLTVIAEGVETKAQLDTLRVLRCPLGQGYHWSPGITPEAVSRWMAR